MLDSESSCQEYIRTQSPSVIARQLREDQLACQAHALPSPLALYLPLSSSRLVDRISEELYPKNVKYYAKIGNLQYTGLVQSIRAYLHKLTPRARHGSLPDVVNASDESAPSNEDIETALRVLDYCVKNPFKTPLNQRTPLRDVVHDLDNRIQDSIPLQQKDPAKRNRPRVCYICQYLLVTPHPQYPSLCKQCGSFNIASSDLSLPHALHLDGKIALVTGGRINLGYHTALRLLRCGARVIISSRYPQDAAVRYLSEKDCGEWVNRLRIMGADFRAANDVFHFVAGAKNILADWNSNTEVKLDILINNAAQTWTDSLRKEKSAIEREEQLQLRASETRDLLIDTSYTPRVRGGIQSSNLLAFDTEQKRIKSASTEQTTLSTNEHSTSITISDPDPKTSWVQNLYDIPYEDFISAHSVNVFVPLILIREFLPLMGSPRPHNTPSPAPNAPSSKPLAHIINVSAREGIFESKPTNRHKNGYHVHTNLAKAALNMLTETEAAAAWRDRRVAMNSVDPGYLSAAPEIMVKRRGEDCPIGWEDGAARVLWSVAVGEKGEGAVWGRFLKDFGRGEGEERIGR